MHIPSETPSALPSLTLPIQPAATFVSMAQTDGAGAYTVDLSGLASADAIVEARFAGDEQRWPAQAQTGP
jgi:hypothetical protein